MRQKAESEKWREFAYSIQEFIAEKKNLPGLAHLFKALRDAGYVVAHKEPNIMYALKEHCVEYNLLLLSQEFWDDE